MKSTGTLYQTSLIQFLFFCYAFSDHRDCLNA